MCLNVCCNVGSVNAVTHVLEHVSWSTLEMRPMIKQPRKPPNTKSSETSWLAGLGAASRRWCQLYYIIYYPCYPYYVRIPITYVSLLRTLSSLRAPDSYSVSNSVSWACYQGHGVCQASCRYLVGYRSPEGDQTLGISRRNLAKSPEGFGRNLVAPESSPASH